MVAFVTVVGVDLCLQGLVLKDVRMGVTSKEVSAIPANLVGHPSREQFLVVPQLPPEHFDDGDWEVIARCSSMICMWCILHGVKGDGSSQHHGMHVVHRAWHGR